MAGVRGVTTGWADAIPVMIDSRRFKEDIADMGAASRDMMNLRPVTFRYQKPFADKDQTGGNALWHEIQNVVVDPDGHYSVLMGATQNDGMPLDLFAPGEPRWLGAQFNRPGESEQPRVLLVSVPYALKAVDAETLGGKPASAYLLATPTVGTATALTTTTATAARPKATPASSGIPNYIGKFINTTDLIDSAMYEVNGLVGVSTATPQIALDVRTGPLPQMGIAQTTDYLTFFASDQYGPAIYWDPAKDMRFGKGGSGLLTHTDLSSR